MAMIDFAEFSRELDTQGYFIWPGLQPHDLIDEHVAAYRALNEREGVPIGEDVSALSTEKREELKKARHVFHETHEATRQLFHPRALRTFLEQHFGEAAVMRQPETGFFHRNTPPHNDSLDLRVSKAGTEVRLWYALEDIHPDAGPMYVLPGTHASVSMLLEEAVNDERPDLVGLLREQMGETSATAFYEATLPLWRYVKQTKFGHAAQSVALQPLLLKKGDAVVFRSDLVHGTCHCNQPGLTRSYAVSYWSSRSAEWYQSRSFWGAPHDHRRPENVIPTVVRETPYGPEISFQAMHAAYMASFGRAVVAREESACA
ncbi:MAG TPA: phytanoyl-CoA dioxygenase family protein [Luteibacter sp.]|jgi:hypothetical protein|uniref:phytanoyl-CoA dioxygenase family protein n=1 Tax=Luteibacter sp. TaxID=1886636 RepID=UPI002F3F9584